MDIIKVLMLFGVGTITGLMNVMAGGGSRPDLASIDFYGAGWGMANGTNRIALVFQNVSAVMSFRKRNFQLSAQLATVAHDAAGGHSGRVDCHKNQRYRFQRILSIVLIIVISMFPTKKDQYETSAEEDGRKPG